MNELISSVSLLLAVVGVLYGVWYKEITDAIKVVPKPHFDDRTPQLDQVNTALYFRSLPLNIASVVLTIIFIPDSYAIIRESLITISDSQNLVTYNAVKASFCFVVLFLFLLSIHTSIMSGKVILVRRKLKKKNTTKVST